jgi:glycerophosphoryl diester phosphodiesterase
VSAPDATATAGLLLDPSARPIIAHRGGTHVGPENTVEAFRIGLALGAEALEFDVRATRDGVPVVIHDATLDRTTDRRGAVAAHTLRQLAEADAGYRFTPDGGRTHPFRGQGVRIPTLEQVIAALPDVPLLIHVKVPEAQEGVRAVLTRLDAVARSVVASEIDAALVCFTQSPFVRGATSRETRRFFVRAALGAAPRRVPFRVFSVPDRSMGLTVPTRRFVAAGLAAGCATHVWTVNDATAARRLWDIGVCGIVTDAPDVIRAARDGGSRNRKTEGGRREEQEAEP